MGFVEAIKTCFSKYFCFEGRARRSEFWYFWLLSFILGLIPVINWIAGIALLIPSLAVAIRRLHDTNRSGWWFLLFLIPLVNLVLIYFYICEGTKGDNNFGPDPKA